MKAVTTGLFAVVALAASVAPAQASDQVVFTDAEYCQIAASGQSDAQARLLKVYGEKLGTTPSNAECARILATTTVAPFNLDRQLRAMSRSSVQKLSQRTISELRKLSVEEQQAALNVAPF